MESMSELRSRDMLCRQALEFPPFSRLEKGSWWCQNWGCVCLRLLIKRDEGKPDEFGSFTFSRLVSARTLESSVENRFSAVKISKPSSSSSSPELAESVGSTVQKCSEYPSDTVLLTNKQQILMVGQAYRVTLYLEMPESAQNDKTGMFTVCATMQHLDESEHSTKACRLSMIHYKSDLLKMISTVVMAPFFILGYREEKQLVAIDLFTNFEDSQAHPVTSVNIAVLSKEIQFYSAQLHVTANFAGLRYLMFNWPILSAIIGIFTNLFFILIVCILSWYHWDDTEWLVDIKDRYQQVMKSSPKKAIEQESTEPKVLSEDEDKPEPEAIEDVSSFQEDLGLIT